MRNRQKTISRLILTENTNTLKITTFFGNRIGDMLAKVSTECYRGYGIFFMGLAWHFEFRAPFIMHHRINRLVIHLDTEGVNNIRLNLNLTLKTFRFLKGPA